MPSFPSLAGEVHAASELNDNYRRILDEARAAGVARLRDRDGTSLLIVREDSAKAALVDHALAAIAKDLVVLLRRGSRKAFEARLLSSSWPWLRWLDGEHLRECLEELSTLFLEAAATGSLIRFHDALHAWQVTAESLEDEKARAVLLAGSGSPDDYVVVERPEAGDGVTPGELATPAP